MIRRRRCCRAPVMKGGFVLCVCCHEMWIEPTHTHTRRLRRLLQLLPSPDQQPRNTQSDKLGGQTNNIWWRRRNPAAADRHLSSTPTVDYLLASRASAAQLQHTHTKKGLERRGFSLADEKSCLASYNTLLAERPSTSRQIAKIDRKNKEWWRKQVLSVHVFCELEVVQRSSQRHPSMAGKYIYRDLNV